MFPLRNFRPAAAAGERGSVDTQKTCKCVPHKTCVARAKRRQSDRAFFSVRVWGRFWRACARRPQWAPSRCALVSPSPAGLRRELLGAARGDDSAAKTLTPRRRPPFSVDPGFASGFKAVVLDSPHHPPWAADWSRVLFKPPEHESQLNSCWPLSASEANKAETVSNNQGRLARNDVSAETR
ncbi:hypothetical protein HPB47_006268 [Ixodes persulcatus]|uniref:Uncharacterized protein n=1 Tax=Ixodes persulcatus TaxID=34615 RepID=A0AC60PAW6_IXOPE|nr:hypothetical protein HPB47_006268 [Ixodes persulcatus]